MIIEVYDAFRSVGIDDEAARRAAGALSDSGRQLDELKAEMERGFTGVDRRFTGVDRRFDQMQAELDRRFDQMQAELDRRFDQAELSNERRFSKLEADMLVMKWMVGAIVAGVLSLVAEAFLSCRA